MPETHTDFAGRIAAEAYWEDDTLADPAWRKVFDAVPRSAFAPDDWFEWNGYGWDARHRADNEQDWDEAVHAVTQPFITQVGDDNMPTCSLSAPMLVAAMLGTLDLDDGMRVFESGTGTGWTAALMAARVGPAGLVVTVEYDPELAGIAVENWHSSGVWDGLALVAFVGDGESGRPALAPFDRVSATHSVRRIPAAWIAQTRPGGLVCAPLKIGQPDLDLYVQLRVGEDGTAEGRVRFPVDFMASRTSRPPAPAKQAEDEKRCSVTDWNLPAVVAAKEAWPSRIAVPGLNVTGPLVEDGDDCMWLSLPDGSWAVAYVPQGAPWKDATVEQHGPQDVWSLAEDAWARWEAADRPGINEYGLSVGRDETHTLWCRTPDNVVAVLN
ncbi:protein-L-isoaspartate(D-aspartate)O-methyltransferase [Catenulispora acidiphila DSM 44928]|uniref:Protein-L-isoaspartate O-methyltransferase n=1 Tax=Catenulispora acidiphila (strain DSM 44928 / JCM 14897 / NBRC 102108 / NRRL B-24433 / ID139908) TaxID=479433 RepID=C7Q2V7_CATAD|nr:protein-L-isoaspartate(D-aspartate) O-methyltransferase [Catenulispora acidiphila]ACU71849.1 protein-L-isoaspartate(D-aspartate)O-methyltransferase [Catenulispora acidiphila DSM 44928]